MIPEAALAIAGPDAHLVARPAGRHHVYAGPLTPSGRFVPRAGRTVCRVRSRQLRVLPAITERSSLGAAAGPPRLCMRCTACLDRVAVRSRQVTRRPRSRYEWLAHFAGTTKADVAFALDLATSPSEVDAAAWLSLLVFDVAGCEQPFGWMGQVRTLADLVADARGRVRGFPASTYELAERHDLMSAAAADQRKAEALAVREERRQRLRH